MKISNFALLTGLAYASLWIWLSTVGHGYDVGCFRDWTVYIHEHGLRHAYGAPRLDYNPLYLEMLAVFARIQGSTEGIKNGFFTFKLYVLLFDFGGVFLAAAALRANKRPVALAWLLLINVAYLYNTLIWGQVDSIFTFFVALSVFLAAREQVELSLLSGLLAVNFKLFAAAYVPLIIVINLPGILKDRKRLLRAVGIGLAAQLLIFLPFLNAKGLAAIVDANQVQIRGSSVLSPSAYNYWLLIAGEHNTTRPATSLYHGLAMKTWGTLMFFAASAVVLAPLVRVTLIQKRRVSDASMFLASGLHGLAFFFFMTGMHERYSHSLILLFGIYAMLSGRYFLYVAISLAVFLNMEKCFLFFHLSTYDTLIFDLRAIAFLFLSVLLVGTAKAYLETKPLSKLQPSEGEEPSRAASNTLLSVKNSS